MVLRIINSLLDFISKMIMLLLIYKLGKAFADERDTNKALWKATEHEFNMVWDKVNEMEGTVITIDTD